MPLIQIIINLSENQCAWTIYESYNNIQWYINFGEIFYLQSCLQICNRLLIKHACAPYIMAVNKCSDHQKRLIQQYLHMYDFTNSLGELD